MSLQLAHVALLVREYDEAIAFFTRAFGWFLLEDVQQSPTKRWVRVGPRAGGAASLLLARAATPEQECCVGQQSGGRVFLFLHTRDFDADYARLATACTLALLVCTAVLDGDVVLVLLMGALIFALALARGGLADLLGRPLMHFWGRASYSLYMVHLLVIPTVYKAAALAHVPEDSALPLVLALACLLAVSSLVYLRVEETARLRLRRLIG